MKWTSLKVSWKAILSSEVQSSHSRTVENFERILCIQTLIANLQISKFNQQNVFGGYSWKVRWHPSEFRWSSPNWRAQSRSRGAEQEHSTKKSKQASQNQTRARQGIMAGKMSMEISFIFSLN